MLDNEIEIDVIIKDIYKLLQPHLLTTQGITDWICIKRKAFGNKDAHTLIWSGRVDEVKAFIKEEFYSVDNNAIPV